MGLDTGLLSNKFTVIIQDHTLHEAMARGTAMGCVLYWLTVAAEFNASPYTAILTSSWGSPDEMPSLTFTGTCSAS